MADVFVVDVDVDEASQPALLVVEMPAEIAVLTDEPLQRVADRLTFDFHELLLPRKRAKRSGNHDPTPRRTPKRAPDG